MCHRLKPRSSLSSNVIEYPETSMLRRKSSPGSTGRYLIPEHALKRFASQGEEQT